MNQCNAKIRSTLLGKEDHGIPTCQLFLEFDDAAQAFGGYDLRHWTDFPQRVLDTLGVEAWEKLPGTYCRIRQTHEKVHAIGHIIEDRWFTPAEEKSAK